MAWRWRDLSVGLYVPLLEFNPYGLIKQFEEDSASATRHLRTFTYLSYYFLYPLGVIIAILGQFAGVKVPGEGGFGAE
jgi:hypothetical protein